jgi:virginiamycin B lyase
MIRVRLLLLASSACCVVALAGAPAYADAPASPDLSVALPDQAPLGITTGADGSIWYADRAGGRVVRAAGGDASTSASTPASDPVDVTSLSTSSGDFIYVAEFGGNSILRIDQATGDTVRYAVPTAGAELSAIATGPDQTVWFAESGVDKVGRLTLDGDIHEFDLPPGSDVNDLSEGPNGAMFLALSDGDAIGRINLRWRLEIFDLPHGSAPRGITGGPDGAAWFTEWGRNRIGRIDGNGSITEFEIPTPENSHPRSIVRAGDNALWFSERTGDAIGRVTTAGDFSSTPLDSGSSPWAITDRGDSLWATLPGSPGLAKISYAGGAPKGTGKTPWPASANPVNPNPVRPDPNNPDPGNPVTPPQSRTLSVRFLSSTQQLPTRASPRLFYSSNLAGRVVIQLSLGRTVIKQVRRAGKAGVNSFTTGLLRRPGRYLVKVRLRSADGQIATARLKLIVTGR